MATAKTKKKPSLVPAAYFTKGCGSREQVYERFEWGSRDAVIRNREGQAIFEQSGMRFPNDWSDTAVQIVSQKYFKGPLGTEKRECELNQMVDRVVNTIRKWGLEDGYFGSTAEADTFANELAYLVVGQYGSFNSPVWFNVGTEYATNPEKPQCSACFINRVDDNMESILALQVKEGMIFKDGSGSGVNLSTLRSSKEMLSGGGRPSGPLSFMKGYDVFAGQIKSGGKTRRAAKMVILNADHPDILEFIGLKAKEEKKIPALLAAGYSTEFNAPNNAYEQVFYQNANNSVRATAQFMEVATLTEPAINDWWTRKVTSGEQCELLNAKNMLWQIAEAAWACGDPGMQFDGTINSWNPVLDVQRINASNPCCFVGETLIDTSEGRIRIDDLERLSHDGRELPYAFSWDTIENLPILRQISRAWKAGETRRLVEVETDKGIAIRCTPEHRFLAFDGQYIPASELVAGTRLRKIGRGVNDGRSNRRYIQHRETGEVPNGCQYQNRFVWSQICGEIPDGFDVHHKNEDTTDDKFSNLELIPVGDHQALHATGAANARFIEGPTSRFLEVYEALLAEEKKTHKKNVELVTMGRWNKAVKARGLKGIVPLGNAYRIQGKSWSEFVDWLEEQRVAVNDRVKSVTFIDLAKPVAVYDIEVEGSHNFAVTNGTDSGQHTLVVHNSEFMFVDDSSCNLASLNLMKFRKADGGFDSDAFAAAVGTFIVAQDILVSRGGYPTPEIERNSHEFRPLGLGYANLGALLMSIGLPYDSDQGRDLAAAITSFMTASAYKMSGLIAKRKGPFHWFGEVQRSFLHVIGLHSRASDDLLQRIQAAGEANSLCLPLVKAANEIWGPVINMCMGSGFRNAQVTLLAPTGTIGFMMDCATTGIEPELSLVKYKSLVGGGQLKLVNPIAEIGLRYLHQDAVARQADLELTIDFMKEHGHVVGAPGLDADHYPVFDTSFATVGSDRFIDPMGHVKMMAAVQPFLSGAISKTVNLPESATIEQVQQVFIDAWKLGLKSVAVYRNGCKKSQPLNITKGVLVDAVVKPYVAGPVQRKMPDTRHSLTHEFKVGGQKAFLIVGLYDDGSPGEIFLDIAKEGSTLSGMVDAWAIAFSFNLQYGVPLTKLIERFSYMRFDPSGFTAGELGFAHSIVDYVVRWLEAQFVKTKLPFVSLPAVGARSPAAGVGVSTGDAPPCSECGAIMLRSGSCFRCPGCGSTSGCS